MPREGQFEAALLIAIREGSWAFPNDQSWSQALERCVLPARQAVLDAAELIIGETTSLDPEQRAQLTGRRPSGARTRQSETPRPRCRARRPTSPRSTWRSSIDCEQQKLIESVDMNSADGSLRGRRR